MTIFSSARATVAARSIPDLLYVRSGAEAPIQARKGATYGIGALDDANIFVNDQSGRAGRIEVIPIAAVGGGPRLAPQRSFGPVRTSVHLHRMMPAGSGGRTVLQMGAAAQDRVGVFAVDDQPLFLDVARDVVAATPGFLWLGSATSGEEALAAVCKLKPQLVFVDVRMPGMDGIETAHRMCASHPDFVVVLISLEPSPAIAPATAASGAAALVSKQDFGPALLRRLWQAYGKPAT